MTLKTTTSLAIDLNESARPRPLGAPLMSAAFGLGLRLDFSLPGLPEREPPRDGPLVDVLAVSDAQPVQLFSGAGGAVLWQTIFEDGSAYSVAPGIAGDHLIRYRGEGAFQLSADGRRLSCATPFARDGEWLRNLSDTVLWSVALLNGRSLLHASAVDSPTGVVAILADQGAGKSSLAAALAASGWPLFTDDILAFAPHGHGVLVSPGPALMNLPLTGDRGPEPGDLGELLARFPATAGEEAWISLLEPATTERPLAAIVLLARDGDGQAQLNDVVATPVDLRPHTLSFRSRTGLERERFEALSDLIERVPVWRLRAGSQVTPDTLARRLAQGLQSDPRAAVADDIGRS